MIVEKKVKWFGHRMLMESSDTIVSKFLMEKREWEKYEGEMLLRGKFIKKGDVVLDIGAHIGYYTLLFARLVGDGGKVFAFEPSERNYNLLEKNVALNNYKNAVLIRKAISDSNGTAKLYLHPKESAEDTLRTKPGWKTEEVETMSLDCWYESYGGKVDFIKMDIEGFEYAAFTGMKKLLEKNQSIKLFVEFTPDYIRKIGDGTSRKFLQAIFKDDFRVWYVHHREFGLTYVNWQKIDKIIEMRDGVQKRVFTNLLCIRR